MRWDDAVSSKARPSVTLEIYDHEDGGDPYVVAINHLDKGSASTPAEILAAYVRCCPMEVYEQAMFFIDERMNQLIRGNE